MKTTTTRTEGRIDDNLQEDLNEFAQIQYTNDMKPYKWCQFETGYAGKCGVAVFDGTNICSYHHKGSKFS